MRQLIIAIDGPSGAGKGTVARAVAEHLAYRHIDTGAMYRAVAWKARQTGVDLSDEPAVGAIAARAVFDLGAQVAIDGEDVTAAIRTPDIDQAAALVARLPAVRAALVARQREYGDRGGLVMEGRDIGTIVFPGADLKFYLDASPEERARRRKSDTAHTASRDSADVETIARALQARDDSDRRRATSPLVIAPDAIYVDTTGLPVADVVQRVLTRVEQRLTSLT